MSCDEVDVASFEHLIHDSRRMAKPASAIKALSSALALWRGPAVPDLAGQRLGAVEAARLDELRRAAEEDLADLRLAHGEHNVLIADLEAAVAAEPLRERRWAQLMLALYRAGRQGDALRAYQRLRVHLGDELGIEPGRDLNELEDSILLQKRSLDWTISGSDAPDAGAGAPRTPRMLVGDGRAERRRAEMSASQQQPRGARLVSAEPSPPLVGRDRELVRLDNACAHAEVGRGGVVLIGGEAGIGKTAIVEEFRRRSVTGRVVVWGLGHDGSDAPPFWMWGQIVRALARSVSNDTNGDRP